MWHLQIISIYFVLISIILRNVFYSAPKTVVHRATKYICIIFENTSGSPCFLIFLTSLSWHTFSPMLNSNWKYYLATLVFSVFFFAHREWHFVFGNETTEKRYSLIVILKLMCSIISLIIAWLVLILSDVYYFESIVCRQLMIPCGVKKLTEPSFEPKVCNLD